MNFCYVDVLKGFQKLSVFLVTFFKSLDFIDRSEIKSYFQELFAIATSRKVVHSKKKMEVLNCTKIY